MVTVKGHRIIFSIVFLFNIYYEKIYIFFKFVLVFSFHPKEKKRIRYHMWNPIKKFQDHRFHIKSIYSSYKKNHIQLGSNDYTHYVHNPNANDIISISPNSFCSFMMKSRCLNLCIQALYMFYILTIYPRIHMCFKLQKHHIIRMGIELLSSIHNNGI